MKGTFRAVGTFETGPSLPAGPIAAAVLAVAVAVWLATILLILAVVLAVVAAALVAAAVMMRRRYPDFSASVAEQGRALRADMAKPAVVEHHHYVHTLPGETAGEASWAPLVRGTVEHMED